MVKLTILCVSISLLTSLYALGKRFNGFGILFEVFNSFFKGL